MREPPNVPEEHLRACLQDQYDLPSVALEFLPRGQDYQAAVYQVMSEQGTPYLLKVTTRPLYEPGCFFPAYLSNQGIASVVAPVPTKHHALWTKLGDWTGIVYPWIDGNSSRTGMANEQWKEVGNIFHQIHQVQLPPIDFPSLRKETFDPTQYVQWVQVFETQHLHSQHDGSYSANALRASWIEYQSTIHTAITTLEKLAEVIRRRTFPHFICHADLHARNLIRNPTGRVFVIDWDEVMLAPKERDFIFIRQPQADAFWEGYGQKEIDWTLLSYYLWERVIQDMIEYAQGVCFRDDLGEETKTIIAESFHKNLAVGGNNITAAYEASTHLTV